MDKANRIKIRFTYAVAALLFVITLFGLFFFSYIHRFNQTLTEENRIRLSEISCQIANYMQTMIEEQVNELQLLASSLTNQKEQVSDLKGISDKLGYEYMGIAGENGLLTASGFKDPIDISDEVYFKEAIEGRTHISDITRQIFYDRAVGGIILAAPIPDSNHQIIVAMLSSKKLGENIQVESFGGDGYSYIIDQDGNLILHSRSVEYNNFFIYMQNMRFAQGYYLDKMKNDILNHKEGMIFYTELGVEKYAYYCPLSVNGWTVISTVPKKAITQRTAVLSKDLIILCASFMVVFFLMLTTVCILYLNLESRRRANLAKSAFLANMSHDMRTPMNAIMGMAVIASTHADEPNTVKECLKKITFSSRHLLGLINDILDTSRIESGKMVLSNENLSLPEVMESTINIILPSILSKKQHFSVRLHNIHHEYFYGDSMRLSQVFINILTNAIKFTPEGGHITIDIEELSVSSDNTVIMNFRFTDTGIGIKPEFMKDLFSAFTREMDSKVDKIEGSGLGMSIAKRIVDLMQGSIKVDSRVGEGTVFTVTLPLSIDASKEEKLEIPYERLLIVGGGEQLGTEAVGSLRELGVLAEWARDDSDMVERMQSAHNAGKDYQVVLIDREIFDLGNRDALRSICISSVTVILFAYDWQDIHSEAVTFGIHQFVQKPLFKSTLSHCLLATAGKSDTYDENKLETSILSGKRILLAEDNELNTEIAEQIFTELGAEVSCTVDGVQCVELFLSSLAGSFDLILMDIQMPRMNGYEASQCIRKSGRDDSMIPIFAMSANAFSEDIAAASAAGMTGYLTKPIDVSTWINEIQKHLTNLPETL